MYSDYYYQYIQATLIFGICNSLDGVAVKKKGLYIPGYANWVKQAVCKIVTLDTLSVRV